MRSQRHQVKIKYEDINMKEGYIYQVRVYYKGTSDSFTQVVHWNFSDKCIWLTLSSGKEVAIYRTHLLQLEITLNEEATAEKHKKENPEPEEEKKEVQEEPEEEKSEIAQVPLSVMEALQ